MVKTLQRKLKSSGSFENRVNLLENICSRLCDEPLTLAEWTEQVEALINALNITSICTNPLNVIKRNETRLHQLIWIYEGEKEINFDPTNMNLNALNYPCAMYDWYTFLIETYSALSDYEVQKDKNAFPIANLYTNATIYSPTVIQTKELKEVIHAAVESPILVQCVDGVMIVKGNFVKSSDIKLTKCPSLKVIKVFVVDTFFVDSDLNFDHLNEVVLYVYAPTWDIIKESTFNLNGLNGEWLAPPQISGTAGKPGKPGQNGGSFFGWAMNIINVDFDGSIEWR